MFVAWEGLILEYASPGEADKRQASLADAGHQHARVSKLNGLAVVIGWRSRRLYVAFSANGKTCSGLGWDMLCGGPSINDTRFLCY